ncbi:MAG TPA: [Fe-S]-binding protein [Chloroflexi bacterium]|nr:[Fe-S]-binding protein [Chloroflexota bacterium]
MLTQAEKVIFVLVALVSSGVAFVGFKRIFDIICRGQDEFDRSDLVAGALTALEKTLSQRTVLKSRPRSSWFHAFVAWGFFFYFLVNLGDVLEGFIPNFRFLGYGPIGGLYRLLADLLSVAVLVGMVYFVRRRFVEHSTELETRDDILLHPRARAGMRRDSAVVAGFILLHVGSRFLGQSFQIAHEAAVARGAFDLWQPFASAVALLWTPLGATPLVVAEHAAWWLALGLILLFLPYFPSSKHLHLVMAPVNFSTKPRRPSLGALSPLELNHGATRFGSDRLENLPWPRLVDSFACIMCNRCQEVCPAYAAGTVLSPSAMEINKRYEIKHQMGALAAGRPSRAPLLESVIPAQAVWACTSCAACVEICPVGNEPMQDIIDLRRSLTLTEGAVPDKAARALRNIQFTGNPWGFDPEKRADWAAGLNVPVMAEKGGAEVLFWVGCSGSYDPRNQKITESVARLMQRAGVDFAILGWEERCNGDPARRMGEEAVFQTMVQRNAESFGKYTFKKVVTSCPHCLNTLRNEYPEFGVNLEVVHHSQFIAGLIGEGKLAPTKALDAPVTFHDSCYLGRYNGEYEAPREVLTSIPGVELREMPRIRARGLCCGGGGGGAFYDVPAERRVTDIRLEEAITVQPEVVASACPFCMNMFEGSPLKDQARIKIKDIAELLDEAMGEPGT